MPVAPTYPGVYIEEIPSGVHTITGVGTSITAFIGFTPRGSVNKPVHIFSRADFERAFGGLSIDSPLSYCVKDFFQNGGTEAYVVRVALGAAPATVALRNAAATVLNVTAASAGTWGNALQIDVDYDTANPSSLFNLRVAEILEQNGQLVPGRTEVFRNLSLNRADSSYVVDTVNAGSQLVTVAVPGGLALAAAGRSESGTLAATGAPFVDASHNRLGFILNGQGPFEITIPIPAGLFPAILGTIATDIAGAINGIMGAGAVTGAGGADTFTITSGNVTDRSSIRFINASSNDATGVLRLGLANGGTETDAAASLRPLQTGTVGTGALPPVPTANGALTIEVRRGALATPLATINNLPIWAGAASQPTMLDEVAAQIDTALKNAASTDPNPVVRQLLAGATAGRVGSSVRVLPGFADPNVSFNIVNAGADTLATQLGFTAASTRNVARYALGVGLTALAQVAGVPGNNGTPPGVNDLRGTESQKTGIYALEDVDLFNLLVMPDTTQGSTPATTAMLSVLMEAIAYCTRRRAFMIIDAPETIATFAQAETWIGGPASPLRSRNAALYFPRLRAPDPLMNNVVGTFPAAGAVAGLYARTDAERGVWKAPAGTSATIVGATGLSYTLNDRENGTLNPRALNSLRTFPVYGTVCWGARTARGADSQADEYKYVPVRRLALFLEETLYRNTQWVVFEPNDEPLWAQIRLNIGAFMHTLFAQGAFQGRTPRDAYFVRCDKETTTQNDIDLGRVNIVVGFAPLKPAEFVIIQIQQIAGAIQV